ncbi:MAG: T9SS C-terminal target domain-containing protein [Calditrichaeota bacterium]|nr:MAG: T9SS C-terminal target domain-containing protein [Calditrichota bacterium]
MQYKQLFQIALILLVCVFRVNAQTVTWTKHVISTSVNGAKKNAVVNLDMDSNNAMDIVVTANPEGSGAEDPAAVNVLWFKNDGSENFTQYNIDFYNVGARGLAVGDLTGNGYPDIVVGSGNVDSSLVWYKNDKTPDVGPWTKNYLGGPAPYNYNVRIVDIDADNDLDIVDGMGDDVASNSVGGGVITDSLRWFENTVSGATQFLPHLIAHYSTPSGISIGDFNGDNLIDVTAGSWVNSSYTFIVNEEDVRWWSQGSGSVWTQQQIIQQSYVANGLATKDLDQNGTIDIIGAGYKTNSIDWWSNDGNGVFSSINTISSTFTQTRNVDVADVDGDGDWDIVAAADNDNTIAWFENDGSQNFTEHVVDNSFTYAYFVSTADLDGDGDTDLIGTAQNANELSWWANEQAEKQWIPAGNVATFSYYGGDVAITFSSKDIGDSTSVFYNHGDVSNRSSLDGAIHHVAQKGYYTLVTAAGTYNASVDFSYAGISEWSTVNNEADLRICVWNDALSQWEIAGSGAQTIDAVNDVITVPGLTTEMARYSLFTLGSVSSDNSLPVELASFSLKSFASGVELSWTTASEQNNLGFEIWRRNADGPFERLIDYKNDQTLSGLGTANYGQTYYFLDSDVETGGRYSYKLVSVDYSGLRTEYPSKDMVFTGKKSIVATSGQIPDSPELAQNYPNPFNGITRIDFAIPENLSGATVRLTLYDMRGRVVTKLLDGPMASGRFFTIWNGKDARGMPVASGTYIYRLDIGNYHRIKRLTLLK